MTSVIGDIRDFASLKAAFDAARPEIVLHLAAQPIVRDSYKDPRYTYETNVMGTVNLLECVRTAQTPPRSVLNVKRIRCTRIMNGAGATAKTNRWTASTLTPTAKAARSW